MKNWLYKVLAIVFMLVLAIALSACGGSNNLEGTYVIEGGESSGISITFSGDNFTFVYPYAEMNLDMLSYGEFVMTGTFTVHHENIISLSVDETALRASSASMIQAMIDEIFVGPDFAELMEDPNFAELMNEYMSEYVRVMELVFDGMVEELLQHFDGLAFRFEGNFDRLYDDVDGIVFVRQ